MKFNPTSYWMGRRIADLYAKCMFNLDVQYDRPLPSGAKILAPNHPTTIDPMIVLKLTDEPVHILIEETLFKVPVFGRYLESAGHVRVIPGAGRTAFQNALDLLQAGETVAIYPEGAISPLAGGMHPLRTGVARLSLMSGAPIIPIGIQVDRTRIRLINTVVDHEPVVGTFYFRGPYAMTVGQPLHLEGEIEDWDFVKTTSAHIRQRILDLALRSSQRLQITDSKAPASVTATHEYPVIG